MARQRRKRWLNRWNGEVTVEEGQEINWNPYEVWKAKKIGVPIEHKTITIKCLGKMHKIELRFPGRFTLHNHEDLRGEITLMKLGGPKPECLKFLEDWKEYPNAVAANRPWVRVYLKARKELTNHREKEKAKYTDWLGKELTERLAHWVEIINGHLTRTVNKFAGKMKQNKVRVNMTWQSVLHRYVEEPCQGEFIRPRVNLSFEAVKDEE